LRAAVAEGRKTQAYSPVRRENEGERKIEREREREREKVRRRKKAAAPGGHRRLKFEKRERKKKLTRIRVKPLEHHLPRLLDPRRRQGRGRRGRSRVRVAEGVLPQVGRQLVHLRVRVERGARGVEVDEAAQPRGDLCRRHGLGELVVVARVGQ
jgi:hypothetical protein